MNKPLCIITLVLFFSISFAIHGTVYDISFEPVPYAVISVYENGTLVSRTLSSDRGDYSIDIQNGTYRLVAEKYGTDLFYNETVSVLGDTKIDIIMFDKLPYDPLTELELPTGELNEEQPVQFNQETTNPLIRYIIGILLICIGVFFILISKRKNKLREKDLNYIISLIQQNGGKIKQKELVNLTGFSEAKVSLLLKELKKRGHIKKKKQGREKIVYLS